MYNKTVNEIIIDGAFFLGTSLIAVATISLLLASLTLLLGGTLSAWILPVAVMFAIMLLVFLCYKNCWSKLLVLMVVASMIIVLLVSGVFAGKFYDKSWDGQAYHQEAVIQLSAGWNPYYEKLDRRSVAHEKWITHYAKGPWILASCIYLFTGNIESAKAFDIIFIVASIFLLFSALLKIGRFSIVWAMLISCVAAMNPVAIYQSLNFYVDGQLASLLLSLLAASIHLLRRKSKITTLLICSLLILSVNVKFTAIPFVMVALAGLFGYILSCREQVFDYKVLVACVFALFVGICAIGYNPYISNTINNGHPFYPLMGTNSDDIMGPTKPQNLKKMNRFQALFTSLFSEAVNNVDGAFLKIPFTISKSEIGVFRGHDIRVSGFGPLFGGMLLISCVIFVKFRRDFPRPMLPLCICLLTVLMSVFIHPESWWARYVPQLWLVPLIVSTVCVISDKRLVNFFGLVLLGIGGVNISLIAISYVKHNYFVTLQVRSNLERLSNVEGKISVYYGPFASTRLRLSEAGIATIRVYNRSDLPCRNPEIMPGSEQIVSYCEKGLK